MTNDVMTASTQSFPIEGMTCASCVRRVEKAIAAVPGVASASVNLATERADVRFAGGAEPEAVVKAIADAGYAVTTTRLELGVEGMTCASCVRRVEKAIAGVPGVVSASVNLATERASAEVIAGTPLSVIEEAIRKAGYEPRRLGGQPGSETAHEAAKDEERRRLTRDVLIAGVLTLPLFVVEMGGHLYPPLHHWLFASFGQQALWIASFVLASLVQFGPGLRFYRREFRRWPASHLT